VVVKQGYIERNFAPSKLFRDVRDFIRENSTTAVTAYGAEESIPACLDILIAGFVCKDLSRLNTRQKDLDSDGESGDTWRAIYSYSERFRPSIVLLENVKSTSSLWDKVVSKWAEIDYEAAWLICDTKRYYVPQTRERMYMIAIERSQFGKNADKAVEQWRDLMLKLQRQCSSPYEAFLKNMLHESSDHSALVSEPDWALCKLRYDHIRSDERLGILRPVTRWSENGTVRYVMPRIEALSLKLSLT
jgi:site-specific DNA-cytosine methylase